MQNKIEAITLMIFGCLVVITGLLTSCDWTILLLGGMMFVVGLACLIVALVKSTQTAMVEEKPAPKTTKKKK